MFVLRRELMKMISAACCSAAFMKRVMHCMNRDYRNQNTDCLQENSLHWEYMSHSPGYGKIMWAEAVHSGNLIIPLSRRNFRKHFVQYQKNSFIKRSTR